MKHAALNIGRKHPSIVHAKYRWVGVVFIVNEEDKIRVNLTATFIIKPVFLAGVIAWYSQVIDFD